MGQLGRVVSEAQRQCERRANTAPSARSRRGWERGETETVSAAVRSKCGSTGGHQGVSWV